jgi:hypothetical protein
MAWQPFKNFHQNILCFLEYNFYQRVLSNISEMEYFKWGFVYNKSVPRHCLRRYRLNLAVQGELPWFLICFLNETMLFFNL